MDEQLEQEKCLNKNVEDVDDCHKFVIMGNEMVILQKQRFKINRMSK
jgi:hypothetical protein